MLNYINGGLFQNNPPRANYLNHNGFHGNRNVNNSNVFNQSNNRGFSHLRSGGANSNTMLQLFIGLIQQLSGNRGNNVNYSNNANYSNNTNYGHNANYGHNVNFGHNVNYGNNGNFGNNVNYHNNGHYANNSNGYTHYVPAPVPISAPAPAPAPRPVALSPGVHTGSIPGHNGYVKLKDWNSANGSTANFWVSIKDSPNGVHTGDIYLSGLKKLDDGSLVATSGKETIFNVGRGKQLVDTNGDGYVFRVGPQNAGGKFDFEIERGYGGPTLRGTLN
ncbi:MAG: hypothetical protein KAH22_00695 [Thiotrichaceae bacterium]|nr:hypothetical protein [Thiotrichaceae bacterium]